VNDFDTAYPYHNGESEGVVGRILVARYPREQFFLATKMPIWLCHVAGDFERLFEEQLTRLQTNYLDFYLLHAMDAAEWPRLVSLGVEDFITRELKRGRIRHIGFSSHDTPENIERIMDLRHWDFVQLQINYLDWTHLRAYFSYDAAVERGLPVIIMEPVRGGGLANPHESVRNLLTQTTPGKSLASWALRWCGDLSQAMVILSGMTNLQQLEDNAQQFSPLIPLSPAEQTVVKTALLMMEALPIIPCTICRYCEVCPQEITIPEIFEAYNSLLLVNSTWGLTDGYLKHTPQKNRADQCTHCGTCLAHCPQHIAIPDELERVHRRALALTAEKKASLKPGSTTI
jgi:predicted aldo/keto reductase-like oxidoreductase